MGDKDKRRRKSSGLGLAIWILAFLILVIIFLVKADEIKENLERAKVFERLFGKTPSFLKAGNAESDEKKDDSATIVLSNVKKDNSETKKTESQENPKSAGKQENLEMNSKDKKSSLEKGEESNSVKNEKKAENPEKSKTSKDESDLNHQITPAKENRIETALKKNPQKNEASPSEIEKKPAEKEISGEKPKIPAEKENINENASEAAKIAEIKPSNMIAVKICFVAIDSDGPVIRKEVGRSVSKDSPLTSSITSLLKGPAASESATGCRTLIPSGTRLYSASVKNGVATLDFSEEFEFNPYGVEGYLGQLMQIVYTATNFSTVDSVQILIEGQKKGYLGSEGVWIGSPLSRSSFR